MKNKASVLLAVLTGFYLFSFPLFSQEKNTISPYLQFQYFKNTDDLQELKTTLTYSFNRMQVPLHGMEILFFSAGEEKKLIGTSLTDENGIATLELGKGINFPLDNKGFWTFITEFKGNDTIDAGSSEISVKHVKLEMSLLEIDSVKTVSLKATISENNKEVPVSGETVIIYIPRMFSLLPVGEATFDETGVATLEFPSDIPGDSEGNLTIIARFEENPTFGNVERIAKLKWGVPMSNKIPVAHRALWTKTPPMWMIITLSVLLTGVWGHYLFAIISLILIKRDSKKQKKNQLLG